MKEVCTLTECDHEDIDYFDLGFYDYFERGALATEAEADDVVQKCAGLGLNPRQLAIYAIWAHSQWFERGGIPHAEPHPRLPNNSMAPAWPEAFERWGWDLLQVDEHGFGCSPLSCNGMGRKVAVNEYCLIETLEEALKAGAFFAVEQPEPGDYLLAEVWRRRETH
ncbi:MAG: hypothetical protein HYZ00_03405 [Candidatus Hydrogenedentes bacterium]|nr:hypothetical protein [Candidatus Hydrogenedentota bacterium]